ncbi:MAG: TIGR03936 family radical SAM-associated protein, partial [Acidobacteriota bacterium]|nr:TIGR03936 family radical SAM-associated protein [Acidobacteriota bacterium]
VKVTMAASTFVPKPFTPFQWFGMHAESDFVEKQERIRGKVARGVQFRHHEHSSSWLEGVLSRADRRMGPAILAAYRRGAVLDGWQEQLDVGAWRAAFAEQGIDADDWATRSIPLDAALPWDVVDALVHKRWLREEHERALAAATLVPCGTDTCTGCAPFATECVIGTVGEHKHAGTSARAVRMLPVSGCPGGTGPSAGPDELERRWRRLRDRQHELGDDHGKRPVYRYRARFEKLGRSRFLGHLDLVRALNQAFRRAGVQVAYSGGFKPRPKVSLSPALGLGISSRAEYIDFEMHRPLDVEPFMRRVNATMPEGLRLTAMVGLQRSVASLQEAISRASYRAEIAGVDEDTLVRAVERFLSRTSVVVLRQKKRGVKRIDLRPLVDRVAVAGDGALEFTLIMSGSGSARPGELLTALCGDRVAPDARLERVELLSEVGGRLVSPLLAGRFAHTA